MSLGPSLPSTKGASKEKSPAVRIQRNEGRRKTERRTRSRRISSFGVQRREREMREKARGRAGWPCEEALGRREVRTEDAGKV